MVENTKMISSSVNAEENPQEEASVLSDWVNVVESFDDMGLKPKLLQSIYGYGFTSPSEIQKKAIMPIISRRDVIAQAQSGTGKTATFSIGALQIIDESLAEVQVLVVAPTRELARQSTDVMKMLSEYLQIKVEILIGGRKTADDVKKLECGPQVIVATPGRLIDLLNRKQLNLNTLKLLIFDEADEMLSRGFLESAKTIVASAPSDTQICLISATMPKEIVELSDQFMNEPVKILVEQKKVTCDGINQFYVPLKKEHKAEVLINLFGVLSVEQCIIFCNSKENVVELTKNLRDNNFMVSSIHAEMEQDERERVMKEFRGSATRVLVTTDLLARGIDVHKVSLVVNYDLPSKHENYIHRIGRCGRYGKKGTAISFVTPFDKETLNEIMKVYDTFIDTLPTNVDRLI